MDVSRQLPALADHTRRAVFEAVARRPQSVAELAMQLPVSRPAVSQHLKVLHDAGLVRYEKVGTRNIYALDQAGLASLRSYLDGLWTEALDSFKSLAESTYQANKGTEMNLHVQELLVRKSIVIHAPVAHVFSVFAEHQNDWWPRSHHIGKCESFTAMLEPGIGGRWYEIGADGSQCDWGRVLVWEPPHRIVLSWDINAQWQYDPEVANEVEIRFIAEGPEQTRIELEHRKIERYADKAEAMRAAFDSPGGWSGILEELAKAAEPKPI